MSPAIAPGVAAAVASQQQGAAQGPSGMEQAQALAEQVRADAMARAAELQAAEAQRAAEAAAQDAAQFQVGPGGEILPGGAVQIDPPGPLPPPDFPSDVVGSGFPEELVIIVVVFCLMIVLVSIGTPIARAYARRLDRRHAAPDDGADGQAEQLRQIQNAVETMAIEVERISENQRYVTRLLAEGSGGAAPLASGRGEAVPVDAGREPSREPR